MKEIVYICIDLLEYTFLGSLLAYLLYGRMQERFFGTGSGKMTSCLLCIQFVLVRLVMSRVLFRQQSAWPLRFLWACCYIKEAE